MASTPTPITHKAASYSSAYDSFWAPETSARSIITPVYLRKSSRMTSAQIVVGVRLPRWCTGRGAFVFEYVRLSSLDKKAPISR